MTLLRYRDAFTPLGCAKRTKDNPAPHTFALATEADGTVTIFCDGCDQDTPTHCCPHNRDQWGEVCVDCSKTDWWLDLCESYWTRRMENAY